MLQSTKDFWREHLSRLDMETPDETLNRLVGKWLYYQALSSRVMARSGFFQSGGAIGFRDQLQDMLAFLHTEPERVKAHILLCAARQFEEGDVLHWWHPPMTGVRTKITDDRLFLPYVTAKYVLAAGDKAILQEEIPFLAPQRIPEGHEDWHGEAKISPRTASLLHHCLRALDSISLGAHGLPLMGGGDWNDGMNAVGKEGKGESVWLGMFVCRVIEDFAPLCPPETRDALTSRRETLLQNLEEHAWDGEWYLRAFFDDGSVLGGKESKECQIDLLSQAWAVLSGLKHGREALLSALDRLWDKQHRILRLLDPPFDGETQPGYIRNYPPGIRENGGQYTHAAVWALQALCRLGEYDLAWQLLYDLLPASHTEDEEAVKIYQGEPYVLSADVSAFENAGRAGWSWYTGSAALLYSVFFKDLLGFEKRGDRARLCPHVPKGWKEVKVSFFYGQTRYVFRAVRGGKQHDFVRLSDDGAPHEILFCIGLP